MHFDEPKTAKLEVREEFTEVREEFTQGAAFGWAFFI